MKSVPTDSFFSFLSLSLAEDRRERTESCLDWKPVPLKFLLTEVFLRPLFISLIFGDMTFMVFTLA